MRFTARPTPSATPTRHGDRRATAALALGAAAVLLGLSCQSGGGNPLAPTTCDDEDRVGGECAGVQMGALCTEEFCVQEATCARVLEVRDAESLAEQLAQAQPGDCLALGAGDFGDISVPPGSSVLGVGAGVTRTGQITVPPGSASRDSELMIRGVSVMGGGILVAEGATVVIDSVQVAGSGAAGIQVAADAAVTVRRSTVEGAGNTGIYAEDARALTVESTALQDNGQGGIWARCVERCPEQAAVTVRSSLVRRNSVIGVVIEGPTVADIETTVVQRTVRAGFEGGGGLGIWDGAQVTVRGAMIMDNEDYGIFVDAAAAVLDGTGAGAPLEVSGNTFGIAVNDVSGTPDAPAVMIEGASLADNLAVGLSLSGQSSGVMVRASTIRNTRLTPVRAVLDGDPLTADVGDGVSWLDGAQAELSDLMLVDNERASILIDGAVGEGSRIEATLEGSDLEAGIAIQGVGEAETVPEVVGAELRTLETPLPVAVPPGR